MVMATKGQKKSKGHTLQKLMSLSLERSVGKTTGSDMLPSGIT